MDVTGNPFRVNIRGEFDIDPPYLPTGKFVAVVYFIGTYVGSFDVTFMDEPRDVEHFLMNYLVAPVFEAFEAAKERFGVTDED